ncbi:sigma-54-dependent Fis family transcriptional regulator [Vibrio maritimus]|uniref:sigma-54-dependent Fis family transcriptional regulator n=1 Tax=Vibrio maritimus TaxID=990268 RepID=UPI001F3CD0D9|nr:sigma-54-dependent Fis family transcriptional regulator [Vibrio maritimus]
MSSANHSELGNALLAISQSLADRNQLTQTLEAVLTAAKQMTMARHGIIYVLDQTGETLLPTCAYHNDKIAKEHPWTPIEIDSASESDPFNFAVHNGEVVLINELYKYNGYDCENIYQAEQTLGLTSQNLLAWPLVDESGNTIGLLVLLDLSVIDNEAALTEFCRMAASHIRQAIWLEQYGQVIENLSGGNQLKKPSEKLSTKSKRKSSSEPVAISSEMLSVFERLDRVLSLPVDVLLRGETGTGKEVMAKYIHENSNRSKAPLVVQNCAAIPEQLLESELFGHKKGSFTGADKDKVGLFEAANGGTLFLDEIGDMPMLLQAKLLRVLQERKVRPVGASKEIEVDVRVIAATHCNLMGQIQEGRFRADLFYRLNVFPITLPPLRTRRDDILPLAEHFVKLASKKLGLPQSLSISAHVRKQLLDYPYPGNVRELKNIIERSVLLSDFETLSTIEFGEQAPEQVVQQPTQITESSVSVATPSSEPSMEEVSKGLKEAVGEYERTVIIDCLRECNWHTKRAAEQLSLPLSTLNHKMKKYDISAAG